jgi:putative Holliday junction resolvase
MRDLHGPASASARFRLLFPSPVTEGVVLGFDFGTRRIGVAIANGVTREARPLATLGAPTAAARWNAVAALVAEWAPERFVVGIPRHPDGAPHDMTARCERFARQLEGRFRRPVARVDERYTSAVSRGTDDVDAAAAAVILQQWFDEEGAHDA